MVLDSFETSVELYHSSQSFVPEFVLGFHGPLCWRLLINPELQLLLYAVFPSTTVCHCWAWWGLSLYCHVHDRLIESLVAGCGFHSDSGVVWSYIFLQVWRWMADLILVCRSCSSDPGQVFLSKGLTTAVFHSSQNSPFVRDRFTIWVIMGRQASSICLRVLVGMMSSSQCLFFMFIMTVHTSISVSGERMWIWVCHDVQPCILVCWWMIPLFSQILVGRIWQNLLQVPHLSC